VFTRCSLPVVALECQVVGMSMALLVGVSGVPGRPALSGCANRSGDEMIDRCCPGVLFAAARSMEAVHG
jgi:hypothetical protein